MRIDDALERFTTQLQADGRSAHTIRQYRRHVRLFARWCADVATCGDNIESIDHEAVARFLASDVANTRPDGKPKKATAMNCLRASIRGFFKYCHEAGYTRLNPARLVRRAVCSPAPPRGLRETEITRLMGTLADDGSPAAKRDFMLFDLMLKTGIRLGSALALDLKDVDFERGELTLEHAKGGRREVVFLGRAILEHLAAYIDGRQTGPLFTNTKGRRICARQAQRRFSMWVERAGITRQVTCHSLRHTLATNLYRKTGDILLVKEALRHKSIGSTMTYARLDEGRLRKALD